MNTAKLRGIYEQSLLVLAASEDKTYRGASIAASNMAWIWGTLTLEPGPELERHSGPYHLVWPRDLYHVATAQKAAGDDAAAERLLDYLWDVQKSDGSWWQNTFVWGTEKWTTEQMDQVSLPIVLAWSLGRTGEADWLQVERAADYAVANGPASDNERWENQGGYSSNTNRDGDRRADLRRRDRGRERSAGQGAGLRGEGRRVAAEGGVLDRDEHRPLLTGALLRARGEGAEPGRGAEPRRRHAIRAG